MARTFVDRGGTFTDVVTLGDDGGATVRKVPSDRAVVGDLAERGDALTFGTTVATNALLTRTGVPALLCVTRGFADLPWLGDGTRPDLFDADARWPAPLCARVLEVGGRLDAGGRELEPLEVPDHATLAAALDGVEAVAIALLGSHRNPAHEHALAAALRAAAARAGRTPPFISLGHRASPEVGYLARVETALVDAAVTPVLRGALAQDRIPPGALAMRSDGSLCAAEALRAPDAVLSGPAGGVLAVAAVAAQAGFARAVGLDMGGTSTDVCRVDLGAGLPRREGEVRVAGVRLRRPMLEVETIAAGGGSILGDDGLRLTVGPTSAGAHPGPQCYGRGGPPTLTDAALVLGLIDPAAFDPPLDPAAVRLPGGAERAAEFVDLAREAMAQAVRRLATARGVDVADHALVAYGGAAGQHAAAVAARLGIDTVLVHPCASVLCAWGQALARPEETAVRALWRPLLDAWPALVAHWRALEAALPALGEVERTVELRHAGTDHALEVRAPAGVGDDAGTGSGAGPGAGAGAGTGDDAAAVTEGLAALNAAFAAEHRLRFGFDRPGVPVEVVNVRVRVRMPAPAPPPPRAGGDPWGLGDAAPAGPLRLDAPGTAIWVPEGWVARRANGLLQLTRTHPAPAPPPARRTPYGVELWGSRFMAVAEQAGETLRRLARSVNIRERLDFSCAVFDGRGHLVANAPHIPVHLGAMGETVRDLLRAHPDPAPGQAWLTNDPAAGGSHLPDLTVVTAVAAPGAPRVARWFVASRGHHVDVGGLTPGSMPPHSRALGDEGFVVRQLPLLEAGRLCDLRAALAGCRDVPTVLADLEAQIAANAHAARLLARLGAPELIDAWMEHLCDVADEAVAAMVTRLGAALAAADAPGVAEETLDAIPLRLALRVEPDSALVVDLSGTGGPHPGNLNAPPAVLRAAVLYALRTLVGRPVPLNDGALRRVKIVAPRPSIVAAPPGAAVAGGNVETSQRLVDLMLRAAGARAASQGTMNNLTLGARDGGDTGDRGARDGVRGGAAWAYYETIAGGVGASPALPGDSGRQVHMTNTRATDVEVLEERLPLRVRRFALRRASGGAGAHAGGDGVVRELEVTAPATAALLATRRDQGAPGLAGGAAGLPGTDHLVRGGAAPARAPWDGSPADLQPGDRVVIETPGGGGWGAPR
ncbi:MAG TPA: hydantoinase B/oxoprolinase family protein [Myxococcota bacterium]|nr:hydantoinase B/oxoprolinase family protein [Myxococcota bacterium]